MTNTDATPPHGDFYVTMRDGKRAAFLLGPYDDVRAALANVARGARLAYAIDPATHWYTFGTARVSIGVSPPGRRIADA